jgi:hypothetical protein
LILYIINTINTLDKLYCCTKIIADAKQQNFQRLFYPSDKNMILIHKSIDPMYFGSISSDVRMNNLVKIGADLYDKDVHLSRTLDYRLDERAPERAAYFLQATTTVAMQFAKNR